MKGTCVIDGCQRGHVARGWCASHYRRWQLYDDPTGGPRANHGTALRWMRDALAEGSAGDLSSCWLWPFQRDRNGYGRVWHGGRMVFVHRLAKELTGSPIPEGLVSRHLCGNGRDGCWRPSHVVAGTQAENMADKVRHGTLLAGDRHPNAKLTDADVAEIRRLRSEGRTYAAIADLFPVSDRTVGKICRGESR